MEIRGSMNRFGLLAGLIFFLAGCGGGSGSGSGDDQSSPAAELIDHFMIYPQAGQDQVLVNNSFDTGYSYQYKGGLWSMYRLYGEQVAITRERHDSFRADERIPETYRSQLDDYSGSGYDRGHLAPNAALDHSEASQRDTFYLSNIVPQSPAFNRYQWSDVEQWIRECSQEKIAGNPLLVITGSSYSNTPETIGNGVAIPEYQYKVVLHLDEDQYLRAFALLASQDSFYWDNLAEHIVSIDQLENQVNADFFSTLPDNLEANLESGVRMACSLPSGVTVSPAIFYSPDETESSLPPVSDLSCGSKTTCSAMTSCSEAEFYLNSCGITRLDSDQDGTPCESICR